MPYFKHLVEDNVLFTNSNPLHHLGVSLRDVNSVRQGHHIIWVWGLGHDVQSMIHHHSSLGMAVHDNRLEGWYCTLTSEGDGFIQIDRVLASVSGESLLLFQM